MIAFLLGFACGAAAYAYLSPRVRVHRMGRARVLHVNLNGRDYTTRWEVL